MGNALVKSSAFTIEVETDYGVDPNNSDTYMENHVLELSGTPTFEDAFDTVERNIIRNAFSSYAPIQGTENTSGSFAVEAHGSGSYNVSPESVLAYKGAFGYLIGPTAESGIVDHVLATTVDSTSSYTKTDSTKFTNPQMYTHLIEVTSTTNFTIGYPVRVLSSDGTTLRLAGFITDIDDGVSLTVLSSCPDTLTSSGLTTGDIVDCGYLFTLRDYAGNQVNDLPSLTMKYWRGNIVRECYTGNIITQFSFDASTGQLIQPSFNWEGKTVSYTGDSSSHSEYPGNPAHSFDSATTSPIISKMTDIFLEDDDENAFESCISNLQFTITNEVFKKQCIATSGIGEVIRTSRKAEGSLSTFYEDSAFQTAFRAETQYVLRAMFNYTSSISGSTRDQVTTPGNILAIYAPQLKFSSVGIGEESGLFKYDTQFSLEPNEGDDELIFAIL